jgi:hypothetical protein
MRAFCPFFLVAVLAAAAAETAEAAAEAAGDARTGGGGGGFLALPYMANFKPFGSWADSQLFPCGLSPANQTASFDAASGLLRLAGKCLGVNYNSFGQDGQGVNGGGCPKPGDKEDPQNLWSYNQSDSTLRSQKYPHICLHATTAREMAPIIQKTCHSVAAAGSRTDPRDQWELPEGSAGGSVIKSRANSSLCLDHGSSSAPFVCGGGQVFCDTTATAAARVADLVARMDLGEKTIVLNGDNPGVPRLGIPPLVGGDELHGTGGCGEAIGGGSGCGTSSPGCYSHSDATLYISLVIIYTQYTGRC